MRPIIYLTSEYPAISHTFIRREISALRRRGLTILPFSVRPAAIQIDENVPAILGRGWWRCFVASLGMLAASPMRSVSAWVLAQQHRVPGWRGLLLAQFHCVEALGLAWMLRKAGASHLHSHFANSGATVGMLAAHCLKLPWSLTLHGISETDPPAGTLLADKVLRADFVACASWFMRAQGMRVVPPIHWHKLHVVRCGVDLDADESSVRRQTGPRFEFVAVGRLSSEKGYPGLIDAFDELTKHTDSYLTIIGDGPLRKDLQEGIQAAGLQQRVRMLGALPEAETLARIKDADALVLPSLMEGLPVVLMEAMALGVPVVAPCVAGIPELITHEKTGLLFRPSDWEHLRECMHRVATDGEMCRRFATLARDRVQAEFAIDIAVEPLARLFRRTS